MFFTDHNLRERGVAYIEYLFLVLLIAIVAIAWVREIGDDARDFFENPELRQALSG